MAAAATGEKPLNHYRLLKFYKSGKLGYSQAYFAHPLADTSWYNSSLQAEGYEWGYYYTKNDSVYMEVRTRREPSHFWVGKLYKGSIHVSHELDKQFNRSALTQPMVFTYKE